MCFKYSINVCVIFILTLLFACDSIEKPVNGKLKQVNPIDVNEVFGEYISKPGDAYAYYELNLDSYFHYVYRGWGCLGGLIDSGKYKINVDTIEFSSSLLHKKGQYSDHNRTKTICLNDEKYLFQGGKLIVDYQIKMLAAHNFSEMNFLLRKDLTVSLTEMLDTNGNGKTMIYNGSGFIFSRGEYRNFKLWEGSEYQVTPDKKHIHIDYYHKGRVMEDTIVKYSSMYREQEASW